MDAKNHVGCDTFVALPPITANGCVVFGKNSDRFEGEVQEIIYQPSCDYEENAVLKCTYIEIPQVRHTYSIVLSKPAWMWGAEMGANEHGVVAGNEAVWTKLNECAEDKKEKLLGMDLIRLGLERSKSAKECVNVICSLLVKYGQGGPCSEIDPEFTYHNSFLICDKSEAWVLETAGKWWAAELITSGLRNISNVLTITTKIDLMSDGLKEHAEKCGYWKPSDEEFNFALAYSCSGLDFSRLENGKKLLKELASENDFKETHMFKLLRDKDSGICMDVGQIVTTSSQKDLLLKTHGSVKHGMEKYTYDVIDAARDVMDAVRDVIPVACEALPSKMLLLLWLRSIPCFNATAATRETLVSVLSPANSLRPDCHWFTGTLDPSISVFKPFFFCPEVKVSPYCISPKYPDNEDPAKVIPRFQILVDRQHKLYKMHQKAHQELPEKTKNELIDTLRALEMQCVEEVELFINSSSEQNLNEMAEMFKDAVETEVKFYK
ncbi:Secernin-2 [Nymphon striatum]|nr:Secernin-2 [Nymphon striatum]